MAKKEEWFTFNKAIALLLVLALFVLIKTFLTLPGELSGQTRRELVQEAEAVLDTLTNGRDSISLLNSNELIEEKIRNLDDMDYEEVKNIFGINNDFCIFIEDISGQVVKIDNVNSGIGSSKIYINGDPCE